MAQFGALGYRAGCGCGSSHVDDLCAVATGEEWQQTNRTANRTNEIALEWPNKNELKLNTGKVKVMFFGDLPPSEYFSDRRVTVTLAGKAVERKRAHRILGLILDDKLSMAEHCRALATDMQRRMRAALFLSGRQWPASARSLRAGASSYCTDQTLSSL